ncbi:hypothetical protein Sango_0514500 [Sesamum angolense]|uniref:Uncharacterized protein n=1 Tax=Sesamum angolense TaxID=2727404 RepID=A0AAE2C198_9LAMI|nr:hypothetical protein Sango_0514500 [Sesamum angolense]
MPSSDSHGYSMPFASFRRSILTIRSEQVHSEMNHDSNMQDLELFQRQVFARFHELSLAKADDFLSVSWIHKLLDAFTGCQEDFRAILCKIKCCFQNHR